MCVEVERPRLAECRQRAIHHELLAPVELGAEPLVDTGGSVRSVLSLVDIVADEICQFSPRGRFHGAGEAADCLG